MLHLDPERLAALADDEPTADEAAHLAVCPRCAAERSAVRELLVLAEGTRDVALREPLSDWSALSAQLRDEGLIAAPRGIGRAGRRLRPWLQAAAAVVIAVGSAAVGRATASVRLPAIGTNGGNDNARLTTASQGAEQAGTARMVSVEDAMALMRRAESDYRLAAAYIAAHDTTLGAGEAVDRYRTRLAALDRVSDAALAAVNEAPSDPVINQYLLSARTARAVTLQQLNSSLPAGMSLASY